MTVAPVSISLPQWQVARKKRQLWVSASAIETHAHCRRKWWLKSVRKLPEAQRQAQTFGTCLHAVIDRFLRADDRGIDPETGQAVNLYPKDWDLATNRFTGEVEGRISLPEQGHLKALVKKAIEEGLIGRWPNRAVEQNFKLTIGEHKEVAIILSGFIDLYTPDRVEDHKSCKDKRYAKSGNALKDDIQMMTYAKMLLEQYDAQGVPYPEFITLRHNSFGSKDLWIKKSEVRVTPAQIMEFWRLQIVARTNDMVELRESIERWHQIMEPRDYPQPCNAYGGCPFRSICLAQESEEKYEARLAAMAAAGYTSLAAPVSPAQNGQAGANTGQKDEPEMSIAAKMMLKGAIAGTPAGDPAPSINPAPVQQAAAPSTVTANTTPPGTPAVGFKMKLGANQQQAPAAAVTQPPVQQTPPATIAQQAAAGAVQYEGDTPPWALAECPVCKGAGFNNAGHVCRLCESRSAKDATKISPDKFLIANEADGSIIWTPREGVNAEPGCAIKKFAHENPVKVTASEGAQQAPAAVVQQAAPAPTPPPAAQTPAQTPPPAPAAAPVTQQAPAAKPAAESKAKGGRPKEGFWLLLGTRVIGFDGAPGSGRHTHELPEILVDLHKTMLAELQAAGHAVTSIYEMDDFARRNAIMARGEEIAKIFKTDLVFCPPVTTTSDLGALLAAIRPYAMVEVIASM